MAVCLPVHLSVLTDTCDKAPWTRRSGISLPSVIHTLVMASGDPPKVHLSSVCHYLLNIKGTGDNKQAVKSTAIQIRDKCFRGSCVNARLTIFPLAKTFSNEAYPLTKKDTTSEIAAALP